MTWGPRNLVVPGMREWKDRGQGSACPPDYHQRQLESFGRMTRWSGLDVYIGSPKAVRFAA